MKRLYWRFYKAARRRDADTILQLIRDFPELHDYVGQAGGLLDLLVQEAPEFLEPAFQAGLSPDAGSEGAWEILLQSAACEGDLERLRLLIRHGADLERRNHAGEVALGYACSWGQLEAVKVLVEAGADVNAIEEDPETGFRNTPLDCTHRHPAIAEYLQSKGARHLDELEG
jgi:hypothetical protein